MPPLALRLTRSGALSCPAATPSTHVRCAHGHSRPPPPPPPPQLAKAGFVHIGTEESPDWTECYLCKKQLAGWEPSDDPKCVALLDAGLGAAATLAAVSRRPSLPSTTLLGRSTKCMRRAAPSSTLTRRRRASPPLACGRSTSSRPPSARCAPWPATVAQRVQVVASAVL